MIGGGGMGAVFKAWEHRLDRLVALKFLSPRLHADGETIHWERRMGRWRVSGPSCIMVQPGSGVATANPKAEHTLDRERTI
jgi:serine/threonine protein kinase